MLTTFQQSHHAFHPHEAQLAVSRAPSQWKSWSMLGSV